MPLNLQWFLAWFLIGFAGALIWGYREEARRAALRSEDLIVSMITRLHKEKALQNTSAIDWAAIEKILEEYRDEARRDASISDWTIIKEALYIGAAIGFIFWWAP